MMDRRPLTVAWISYFPIEWLPELPDALQNLPRQHPAPWQRVLVDELKREPGLALHVLAIRKQFQQDVTFTRAGVTFHCLRAPAGARTLSLFWWDTWRVWRVLRKVRPDLIHAWGTERGAALVASRLRFPYLVTLQGLLEWYASLVDIGRFQRLEARLERIALLRSRTATAESTFSAGYVRERYPHLDVRHIDVVPEPFFQDVLRRSETTPPRLLFTGELSLRKGADVLLLALNELDEDFRLVVAGSGPGDLVEQLRSRLSPRTWSKIELKGQLPPAAVAEEMARATMLVCPTRADTGPMAVKEAAMAGLPVLGTQVGGIPDYIVPGKNGLLFVPDDVGECAQAIRRAMHHPLFSQGLVDPPTLAAVREKLSPRRMAQAFLETYRHIASR